MPNPALSHGRRLMAMDVTHASSFPDRPCAYFKNVCQGEVAAMELLVSSVGVGGGVSANTRIGIRSKTMPQVGFVPKLSKKAPTMPPRLYVPKLLTCFHWKKPSHMPNTALTLGYRPIAECAF